MNRPSLSLLFYVLGPYLAISASSLGPQRAAPLFVGVSTLLVVLTLGMFTRRSITEHWAILGFPLCFSSLALGTTAASSTILSPMIVQVVTILQALGMEYGWLPTCAAIGAGVRIALLPIHHSVNRRHYLPIKRHWSLHGCTAINIVALTLTFLALGQALPNNAGLLASPLGSIGIHAPTGLIPLVMLLALVHGVISLPTHPRHAIIFGILTSTIWIPGMLGLIAFPLMVALLAGELMAILLQVPAYASDMTRRLLARHGYRSEVFLNDKGAIPQKWRLASEFIQTKGRRYRPTKGNGILVDLSRADPGAAATRILRIPSRLLILRSAPAVSGAQPHDGYCEPRLVPRKRRDIAEALRDMSGQGCDHVWAQPYIDAKTTGTMRSLSSDGLRGELVYGAPRAATEGRQDVSLSFLDTKPMRRKHAHEWKLLRAVEQYFSSPVHIEYAWEDRRLVLLQVRLLRSDEHEELALYPEGVASFAPAEDTLARSSRLAGDVLEYVSRGHYRHVRGHNYQYRTSKHPPKPRRKPRLAEIEARLIALCHQVEEFEARGAKLPGSIFRSSLSLCRDLHDIEAGGAGDTTSSTMLAACPNTSRAVPDLEIAHEREINLDICHQPRMLAQHDHAKLLISLSAALMSRVVAREVKDPATRADLRLVDIL